NYVLSTAEQLTAGHRARSTPTRCRTARRLNPQDFTYIRSKILRSKIAQIDGPLLATLKKSQGRKPMSKQASDKNTSHMRGEDLIKAMRQDYGTIDIAEMFSRYKHMYRSESVPVAKIAMFTEQPEDPLLNALY